MGFDKIIIVLVNVGGMLVGCKDDSEETDLGLFTQVGIWGNTSVGDNSNGSEDDYGGGSENDSGGSSGSNDQTISFNSPNGIANDANDDIYITEFQNNRVRKFSSNGELLSQWGTSGNENGQFLNPTGIAIDSEGNIYVSESGNHRVQKFSANGQWSYFYKRRISAISHAICRLYLG